MDDNKDNHILGWISDAFIVLLNLAAGRGNYLLFKLLHLQGGVWVVAVVIAIDIMYLLLRNNKKYDYSLKYSPFWIIFILLIYNLLNVVFHGFGSVAIILENLVLWLLFYLILIRQLSSVLRNTSTDAKFGVTYLARGYMYLTMISVIGVFLTFVALLFGFAGTEVPIETDYMDNNAMESGISYTWTFLSVNLQNTFLRVPFFQDYGILTGLFHEPHILALNVFPCLILLLGIVKTFVSRMLVITSGVLIMLFCGSVTNILVVLGCIVTFYFLKFKHSPFITVMSLMSIALLLVLVIANSDDTFWSFFLDRMDSGNASHEYTEDMLLYTFSPQTFWGTNFLSTSFMSQTRHVEDIGFVPMVLAIIFLFYYFRNIVKLLLSKSNIAIAVGLSSLYLIMHSAKGGLHMFYQTVPELFIILQMFVLNYYGRIGTAKKDL